MVVANKDESRAGRDHAPDGVGDASKEERGKDVLFEKIS